MDNIKPVDIGGVMVGDDYPTVFMAETSTFFNKDVDLAVSYVKAAKDAGVPIFKSEILHDPDCVLKDTGLLLKYNTARGQETEDYRKLVERKVLPLDGYREILGYCRELEMPFVLSVYDFIGVDFLIEVGGSAVKISRHNINNVPLIRYAAKTGLPVIFDAGVVYFDEVARAVRLAQENGASGVIVNHHPGANPAPPEVHNMRIMQTYKDALRIPVGLSCHYRGEELLYLSVGMGANILEKGIVEDPDKTEQDIVSATKLSDLEDVVTKVKNCWAAIGRAPAVHKEPRNLSVRSGLTARRDIKKGEILDIDSLRWAWPPLGISVEYWDMVVGNRTNRDIAAGEVIEWRDIHFEG